LQSGLRPSFLGKAPRKWGYRDAFELKFRAETLRNPPITKGKYCRQSGADAVFGVSARRRGSVVNEEVTRSPYPARQD
jgi:hypothetical protein